MVIARCLNGNHLAAQFAGVEEKSRKVSGEKRELVSTPVILEWTREPNSLYIPIWTGVSQ